MSPLNFIFSGQIHIPLSLLEPFFQTPSLPLLEILQFVTVLLKIWHTTLDTTLKMGSDKHRIGYKCVAVLWTPCFLCNLKLHLLFSSCIMVQFLPHLSGCDPLRHLDPFPIHWCMNCGKQYISALHLYPKFSPPPILGTKVGLHLGLQFLFKIDQLNFSIYSGPQPFRHLCCFKKQF